MPFTARAILLPLPLSDQPDIPLTPRPGNVHCPRLCLGSNGHGPREAQRVQRSMSTTPKRGGDMRSWKSLFLVTVMLLLVPAAPFANANGWMIDARAGIGAPTGTSKNDFTSGCPIDI